MSKEELKKLKKELENSCISLTKFLINYCGIYNEQIHNIKISHQDIKELLPEIRRVSFESLLGNKNSFYTGDIIPVKDCYGNVVPYINPKLEIEVTLEIDCEKIEEEHLVDEVDINEDLSCYELVKLCRLFKEYNRKREYRLAHKFLKNEKNDSVKQYKKRKDILIMKGREKNEEY